MSFAGGGMSILLLAIVATALSAVLVRAAIAYAHRRGMLDQPGQRRSHTIPTPRGGGIGLVAAAVATMPIALIMLPMPWSWPVAVTLATTTALTAGVGWWDDHRSLPILPRLGIQLLACAAASVAILCDGGLSLAWLPLLLVAGVWSINLHNFMDGIDGLLAQQAIFVGAGLGWLAWMAGQPALAGAAACLAAASLGFWFFNRPRARIFMGDVGSGTIGLLIFALTAMLWRTETTLLWPALTLSSSFVVDAALTLLNRMLAGKRWYTPHREHLYQWLVRSGMSHAAGGMWFLVWNVLVSAPLAILAWIYPKLAFPVCALAYLAASAAWTLIKRQRLRRAKHRVRHVVT